MCRITLFAYVSTIFSINLLVNLRFGCGPRSRISRSNKLSFRSLLYAAAGIHFEYACCLLPGIVCKEFSPGGKFNLAKCRALQTATLETEASCSSEIRDLFNTCSVHSTSPTCSCVSSSQLFICHSFLDVESLKYYDCDTWERHARRILKNDVTTRIQQLCNSQLKLIHSAQVACAKTKPTAPLRVCDILPNITTVKQLSCDELPAYAAYSLKNAHEVETNCLSKASALWAAKAACRTELTAQGISCRSVGQCHSSIPHTWCCRVKVNYH